MSPPERTKPPAGSGDPVLDRRHAWAQIALDQGEAREAAEILDQTLAQAPGFVAAWHLYGQAQEALGRHEEAADAWRHCLALDPDDPCGARLDLARIGALPAEQATSEAFSGALFDRYAARFDSHLVGTLRYTGPALMHRALTRLRQQRDEGRPLFHTVYDLGCGTGLMGEALRQDCTFLAGCDLSPRMVEQARAKRRADGGALYDKLAVAELGAFLASRRDGSADLVTAADVFVYLGDLSAAFAQSARVLERGGLVAFTVQSHDGEGVVVGADRRFHHGEAWLRERLEQAGLTVACLEAQSVRHDRGAPVPGLLVVARKG